MRSSAHRAGTQATQCLHKFPASQVDAREHETMGQLFGPMETDSPVRTAEPLDIDYLKMPSEVNQFHIAYRLRSMESGLYCVIL